MIDLYDKLLTPEWRTSVSPANLADSVLQSLRSLTAPTAALADLTLGMETTRPYYRVVTIPLDKIEYVNVPALGGEDAVLAGDLVAGAPSAEAMANYPNRCAKYRFYSELQELDAFGCGLKPTALRGRDFYYLSGYYWFNEHPSAYGTVGVDESNRKVLTLVALGGELSVEYSPLDTPYHHTADETARQAIKESVYGGAPNGITRALLESIGGCRLSGDTLKATWLEGDLQLGITENGDFVYAPVVLGLGFSPGEKIDMSSVLGHYDKFVYPTDSITYIIRSGLNDISDYPEILKRFPNIRLTDNQFIGAELLTELQKRGCVFYVWPYINNDAHKQEALSNFASYTGRAVISTDVVGHSGTLLGNPFDTPEYTVADLVLTNTGRSFNF